MKQIYNEIIYQIYYWVSLEPVDLFISVIILLKKLVPIYLLIPVFVAFVRLKIIGWVYINYCMKN